MADSTGGGRQIDGFHGLSLEYMRSPKFLAADGGYARVVWMPADLKEQMRSYIPAELFEKIATEKDVKDVGELRAFLTGRAHPVVSRWQAEAEKPGGEGVPVPVYFGEDIPVTMGGFKITFKNARIYADRVIVQSIKPKKPGAGE
jgi:acetyl-CoA decarbonylase/synthase complex subunit beta